MYAYASLHTSKPQSQSDCEGVYTGYRRMPINCQIGSNFLAIVFPEIEEDTDLVTKYIAIGEKPEGDGEIFTSIEALPHIALKRMEMGRSPRIAILYPATLPESARIIHQMVSLGMMRTGDIEPKFFEIINNHLEAAGIPILTVVRSAAATWVGDINHMPGFGEWIANGQGYEKIAIAAS